MDIFAKFVVQKCSLSMFFSICQADSENIMDNSVSAWTSKGRWNTGKKIRQIRAEWAALVSLDLQGPSRYRDVHYIFGIYITNGEKNV